MVEILAIKSGDEASFCPGDRMPDPTDIVTVCSSLISCKVERSSSKLTEAAIETLPDGSTSDHNPIGDGLETNHKQQISLAHFSVKEYLLSDRCTLRSEFEMVPCHDAMAQGCLLYLLHLCGQGPLTHQTVQQYPLARYSAQYWWRHAQQVEDLSKSVVLQLASQLLNNRSSTLTWVRLFDIDDSPHHDESDLTLSMSYLAQPLYYAASIGIPDIVRDILQRTTDINAGHDGRYPLCAAASRGHEPVVRMLLLAGADIDAFNTRSHTALQAASMLGQESVVRVLLDAGASLYGRNIDSDLQSALEAAISIEAYHNDPDVRSRIVQMLLDAGTDRSARSAALGHGILLPEVLDILLKTDIDIDSRGSFLSTPLQGAVFYGLEDAVRLLLNHGADPNAAPGQGDQALGIACKQGHNAIAEMLLDSGATLSEDNYYLYSASECGRRGTIQVLLRKGVDVNQKGQPYGFALQAAAANNYEAAVQQLLDAGAAVNMPGGYFGNVLQAACADSRPELNTFGTPGADTSRRIRKHHYDPNDISHDGFFSLALEACEATLKFCSSIASENDVYTGGCELYLQAAPDNAQDMVAEAVADALTKVVGVTNQIHAHDALPIVLLAQDLSQVVERSIDLMDDLTDREAPEQRKAPTPAEYLRTIVSMTQRGHGSYRDPDPTKGYEWTVQALLDAGGATIQIPGEKRYKAFDSEFIGSASVNVVRSLLRAGAEVNAQGGPFGSALQAASRFNHADIVKELLEYGAEINIRGGEFETALQAACASFAPGEELVQLLLNTGANVNIQGGVYGSALGAACYRGSATKVRLLLDAGADVNIQGGVYGTPLQAACASPNLQMELVRILLDAGAKDDVQGIGKFGSAMSAIQMKIQGYKAVIKRPNLAESESEAEASTG